MAKKSTAKSKPSSSRSPARRNSGRSTRRQPSGPDFGAQFDRFLEFLVRDDTIGFILLGLAALTFFSLISPRGTITEGWIQSLRRGFGIGVWFTPFLFGITGLWLVLRKHSSERAPAGQAIGGMLLLFVTFEVAVHLLTNSPDPETLAEQGNGGGRLGFALSDFLINSLGPLATLAFLVTGLVLGGVLLVGLTRLSNWLREREEPLYEEPESPFFINPPLFGEPEPLPPPAVPTLGERLRGLFGRFQRVPAEDDEPVLLTPRVVGSMPVSSTPAYRTGPVVAPQPPAAATRPAQPQTQPQRASNTPLPPMGGATPNWQVPNLDHILDEAIEQDMSVEDLARRARLIEDTLRAFGIPVTVIEVNRGPAITQFGLRPDFIKKRYRKTDSEMYQEAVQRLRSLTRSERAQVEAEARARLERAKNDQPTSDQLESQMIDLLSAGLEKYVDKDVKIKVARIQALSNDLALALEASPIRIEAPVPGRSIVGLEVPNMQTTLVTLRSVMESENYGTVKSRLKLPLGQDVSGQPYVADLGRMPHLLIAGSTGSGKSVCVNTIIASLLFNHTPETLRFLMVDPKMVELTTYNGIPHLIAPVVTEVDRVVPILAWATREMERRYKMFSQVGARNVETFNEKMAARGQPTLPFIVIIIDELADLMMAAPDEVEKYICRLAQMARATGMHLILATQRPSVDVVTGLIKANFPARIAFAVTSQIDSRVILDNPGAERLLGRGDMLFMDPTSPNMTRLQGCYVADRELHRLVEFWQQQQAAVPVANASANQETVLFEDDRFGATEIPAAPTRPAISAPRGVPPLIPSPTGQTDSDLLSSTLPPPGTVIQGDLFDDMFGGQSNAKPERDALYKEAVDAVREAGRASVSLLQRRLRVGYSRAARLIELMEEEGIVGPDMGGSLGRAVILPEEDAEDDEFIEDEA